jgi:hypothetical protein
MSTTVTYKGQTLTTVENQTKTLNTAGTWVEGDFTLTDASLDISDTTATASDVAQGKVFYSNTGVRTVGTGATGGWTVDGFGQGIEPYGVITYTASSAVDYAFSYNGYNSTGITEFYAPNLTTVPTSAFSNARKLVKADLPVATTIKGNAFNYARALTSLHIPLAENLGEGNSFSNTSLEVFVAPSIKSVLGNDSLVRNNNLTTVDLGEGCTRLNNRCMQNSPLLGTVILRGHSVVPLNETGVFNGTKFANGGAGGEIFVPSAQIENYKVATNWSTVDGWGTITWKAIEGSQYENYYADGTEVTA